LFSYTHSLPHHRRSLHPPAASFCPSHPTHVFLFHVPPPPDTYTLSLHDALPIWTLVARYLASGAATERLIATLGQALLREDAGRSEEHTSELQSLTNIVCRLLLEKKKRHSDHAVVI